MPPRHFGYMVWLNKPERSETIAQNDGRFLDLCIDALSANVFSGLFYVSVFHKLIALNGRCLWRCLQHRQGIFVVWLQTL
ncbi:MAG: hypothetical protein ACLQU4_00630 [Limisphaerales bacterium]